MASGTSHEHLTASQIRDNDHGAGVSLDDIRSALGDTRILRLASGVLAGLPTDIEFTKTETVHTALLEIHERLCKAEMANLRTYGLSNDYLVIRPINPMNPPGPEAMEQVTAAIRTLARFGLIVPAD
jgi:hypothetical protein